MIQIISSNLAWCCIIFLIIDADSISALIQFQQRAKINAAGAYLFGTDVALSDDGSTAMVSEWGTPGAVRAYVRNDNIWSQQGPNLFGTNAVNVQLSCTVTALSADGNTALLGSDGDNTSIGATWVFIRNNGVWSQQGPKLVGSGGIGQSKQGHMVKLSADGNVALVGGYRDNGNIGAAWMFTRNTSTQTWTQQGAKMLPTANVDSTVWFGTVLAISGDGNTAAITGYRDNTNTGATWVFIRGSGSWVQQGSKMVATGYVGSQVHQGHAVALSFDGDTMIISAAYDNSGIGAVWVFTRKSGIWSQLTKLVGSNYIGTPNQGFYVSLNSMGSVAAVGGWNDNNGIGACWIFARNATGDWVQQGSRLIASNAIGSTVNQGYSVALSGNGNVLVIGGNHDNYDNGSAWFFTVPETATPSLQPSTAPTASPSSSHPSLSPSKRPSLSPSTGPSLSPSSTPSSTTGRSENVVPMIAGSVIGGIFVVSLALLFYRFRKMQKGNAPEEPDEPSKKRMAAYSPDTESYHQQHWKQDVALRKRIEHALAAKRKRFVASICEVAMARNQAGGKKLAVFISYHQEGAAGDANAIYDHLVAVGIPPKLIFFDKQSILSDLRQIVPTIKASLLVLQLQSKEIYTRPFTLIEAYESIMFHVPIIPVALVSYNLASSESLFREPDFAEAIERVNPGCTQKLKSFNMDASRIGAVLKKQFPSLISLKYTSTEHESIRLAQLNLIALIILETLSRA